MLANGQSAALVAADELVLDGNCGYRVEDGRVVISIERILNNRAADNISGTLSLEMWATRKPFNGGQPEGICTASTTIGSVYGQHQLNQCQYDLIFTEPTAGYWYLSVLLREWAGSEYQTRDFVAYAVPYQVVWNPVVVETEARAVQPAPVETVEAAVVEAAVVEAAADTVVEAESAEPETVITEAVAVADVAPKSRAGKASARKPRKAPVAGPVDINHCSLEELVAVKGLPVKVAEAMMAARPFARVEDILMVKGMGPKLYGKMKDALKV